MDQETRWQVAGTVLLGGVLVATLLNTCAIDRLERQVIRVAKTVEKLEAAAGSGGTATTASPGVPGTPTGVELLGLGGRRSPVLHVEGAAPGAPLALDEKPLPQGDVLVNRRQAAPKSLNYYLTNEGESQAITRYVLGSLVELDLDAPPRVVPGLAASWETSPDGLRYTFHLRRGVQFADGRPFTSADVRFTFDVVRDPAVQSDFLRGAFDDVVALETPDAHTVVVRMRRKYWKGLYAVGHALRILDKGWYEERIPLVAAELGVTAWSTEPGKPGFGDVFNRMNLPSPGTGPYAFTAEEYDPSLPVDLVQNPFHWGIQVRPRENNLRGLRFVFVPDAVAAFEELRKERIDVTTVDFHDWDADLSRDPAIAAVADYYEYDHMGLGYSFIAWNNRRPPFDDARVRRALTHLVDRRWIVDELDRGRGQVAVCPGKPTYPGYAPLEPIPTDPAAARKLLAEAGWADSDGDGVLDRDGERFEFEVKLGSPRPFYAQVAGQLAQAAKDVGIGVTVRNLEWAAFIDDVGQRRFDAIIVYQSFNDPWIDPMDELHGSQDVPDGANYAGWHNARADRLMEAMREELDDGRRDEMSRELCALFVEDQPLTLLSHPRVGVLVHKRFRDLKVRPTGLWYHDLWVEPSRVLHGDRAATDDPLAR